MTVRELLFRIDSKELTEWMAFYSLEPWGTEPEDVRTGIIASTVANANRDPKKKAHKVKDFMPQWYKPEQTPEDHKRIIEMWQNFMDRSTHNHPYR